MANKSFSAVAALLMLAGCMASGTEPPAETPSASPLAAMSPEEAERVREAGATILFWDSETRDRNFRAMETLFPADVIAAGSASMMLPEGQTLADTLGGRSVDDWMVSQRMAGLVVLHNGEIVLERYARGFGADGRWTSFSVAKSFTSTLVGAAVEDGLIDSLDDPVTRYIPELAGSGYDGVSIRQILTMTSGVRWNEDYTDPQSDVVRMYAEPVPAGVDPTVAYLRTLPREHAPGTHWQYKTGETNLIGVLVSRATGRSLADYLSEKIWRPVMVHDGVWMVDASGQNIGGCCLSATMRDYARMGQLVLNGGMIGGTRIVPENWFAEAGTRQADIGAPGRGYGYQWWTYDDGNFGAQGIFGQGIFIDPARNLVIATNGNWDRATGQEFSADRRAFYTAVQEAIDGP